MSILPAFNMGLLSGSGVTLSQPHKSGIQSSLPLLKKKPLEDEAERLAAAMLERGLNVTCDKSGVAIGRKYARLDEVGAPFAITVDMESLETGGVTVRERDSQNQIRVPVADDAVELMARLCDGSTTWERAYAQYAK